MTTFEAIAHSIDSPSDNPRVRKKSVREQMDATQLTQQEGWLLYLAATGCPTLRIPVRDSETASFLYTKYRDFYGLGASEMKRNCGNVYDSSGTVIARISYNGRAWNGRGELMHEACHP
jgi:hypothetical protein